MDIILFLIGALLLWIGAELLITNSIKIASAANISKLFIGLTIVALGTSLPELIVNISASLMNESDIVIGNVIGSNIANIGLVLSLSLFISKMNFNSDYLNKDFLLLLLSISIVTLFIYLDKVNCSLSILLFTMLVFYIYMQYLKEDNFSNKESENTQGYNLYMFLFVFVGSLMLAFGSELFIDGAIRIADRLNVPKIIVSVTLVALGTSIPELVTCIVAAFKHESDFIIGNILGSNIINVLCVLALSLLISPIPIEDNFILYYSIIAILLSFLFAGFLKMNILNKSTAVILLSIYIFAISMSIKAIA